MAVSTLGSIHLKALEIAMTGSAPEVKLLCGLCFQEMTPGYIFLVEGRGYHQACATRIQNNPYLQKLKKIEDKAMEIIEEIDQKRSAE